MAKILDRLYNRVIDGEILEISDAEITNLGLAKASEVGTKLYLHSGEVNGDTYNIVCPVAESFNANNIKPYYVGNSSSNSTACYLRYEEGTFSLLDLTGVEISSGESIDDEVTPL